MVLIDGKCDVLPAKGLAGPVVPKAVGESATIRKPVTLGTTGATHAEEEQDCQIVSAVGLIAAGWLGTVASSSAQ